MRKFNLLSEPRSLRSTVRPDTPVPGEGGGRLKMTLLAVAVFALVTFASFSAGFGFNNLLSALGFSAPAPQAPSSPATVAPQPEKPAAVPPRAVQTPEPVVAMADEPAPDEMESAEKIAPKMDPVMSRPVAEGAAAPGKKGGGVWRVRFAVCSFRKSCEEVAGNLRRKKIGAKVVKSAAELMTTRVVAGPFPTVAHAEKLQQSLDGADVENFIFSSGPRFYVSTAPFDTAEEAGRTRKKIEADGHRAETVSKKEPRVVYKVFEGAYKSRERADNRRKYFKSRGIKCVIEKDETENDG